MIKKNSPYTYRIIPVCEPVVTEMLALNIEILFNFFWKADGFY